MSDNSEFMRNNFGSICKSLLDFFDEHLWEDERLLEFEKYFYGGELKGGGWNIEKVKILFELLKLRDPGDAEKILSYMENIEYGWRDGRYHFNNHCLRLLNRGGQHCKRNFGIDNTPEATEDAFKEIYWIFLTKNYGEITTYLFGYSLAALFSSRLKLDQLRVPYFLQIACERNSNLYKLIHEIVDICDVNTSLTGKCSMDFDYGYCDYEHVTVFPTQNTEKVLDGLASNRDVPVIIDGYENDKFYAALLREVVNMPNKRKDLSIKDRFNVLPIFICPVIKSRFKNVFSLDLIGLNVIDDYLELVRDNKQRLASWALELVRDTDSYFFPRSTDADRILRKNADERPFFDNINKHINHIRTKYRHYSELTTKDVTNIGYLTYFLSRYFKVFEKSIRLTYGTEFTYRKKFYKHNPAILIESIMNESIELLFELHNSDSPTLLEGKVIIDTKESDPVKSKQIKKKGEEYAKNIVKFYQSYGVSIKIPRDAEFVDGRYVFSAEILPGTDKKMISRYADEVRRLLGLEFFMPDISRSSIKFIASEKPLKESSLIKILESSKFKESKMKIPYAVGYDVMGEMVIADVAEFPHLLIGGATHSGKSSALHSLLMSIIYKTNADEVKLLLLDFGASKLNMFSNIPHLLKPVVTVKDIEKGQRYITALRNEMERRLDILEINEKKLNKLPSIVCIIDEFQAFMRALTTGKGNKNSDWIITDLLGRARKVKIHIVLAAQDTTKGNIKIKITNLPAAIAFRCTNWRDSEAILNAPDAVNLYGKGSLYFKSAQHEGLLRLQGSFMDPEEISNRLESMEFDYDINNEYQIEGLDEPKSPSRSGDDEFDSGNISSEDTDEKLLADIIFLALGQNNIPNYQIKKKFEIGYDKANKFLDKLETLGLVTKPRKGTRLAPAVIPKRIEDIPAEVLKLLAKHDYTEDNITNAFNKMPSKVAAQDDSGELGSKDE
ncbi:MAG: hypothetical protein LBL58_17920 [Tannerellaceae bacterium]|jgi:S-DNA-T family DNA segregation ATPase FtsK/SpoIIIE|nr:hypothetical protein [Tannerellaceae bacterium]